MPVVTAEWIVVAILAVGVAGTVAVVSGFRRLADADQRIADQVAAVDHRVARLEGTIDTLQPVVPEDGAGSTIWMLRDSFVEEHGDLEADLELPLREVAERRASLGRDEDVKCVSTSRG
ncbi:MAG: hypothetical protein OXJ90_07475 [Spirochaetaceae bacterium]|nr:hypothetical protein [Spirochaetaceae bacterium]